jgi:hypothetical protein
MAIKRDAETELASVSAFRLDRRRQRQFQVADLERILVIAQRRVIRRRRNAEARRQPRIQQARSLQFLQARQIAERLQAELRQEGFRGSEGQRTSRRLAAAARPIQPVSSSTSSVPLEVMTPRISSISARVTGW